MRVISCLAAAGVVVVTAACKSSTNNGNGCSSTGANAVVQASDGKQFNPASLQIGQTQGKFGSSQSSF